MNIRAKIFGGASLSEEPLLKRKTPKGAKADELRSVNVSRETRRQSNSRGGDRHRLTGERARITYDGRKAEVELVNLSGGGAMVSGDFEPLIWDTGRAPPGRPRHHRMCRALDPRRPRRARVRP